MTPNAPALRTVRNVVLALAAGYCIGLVACQKPGTSVCPSGRFCPDGSGCAAMQDVCIFTPCGNGKLDAGEVCDDGNILDSDGCSSTCRSNETCGNGIWDPLAKVPEVCDVALEPDDCNSTCSSNLRCGNGKVDADKGEQCDEVVSSPPVNTPFCTSHCTWSRRGDGWINPVAAYGAEQCDRDGAGNNVSGAASDTCEWVGTVGTTLVACNADCTPSRHGDGRVNPSHGEQCDVDGVALTPALAHTSCESQSCTEYCRWSSCGDGVTNRTAGEACDDAHADDHGDCTRSCLPNRCGDGIRQLRGSRVEACDLGDDQNVPDVVGRTCGYGQTCTFCLSGSCAVATVVGPYCGDGAVNGSEECDSDVSRACGTCSNCRWVWPRAAQGSIDVAHASSIVAGDTITIDDGASLAVLEFSDLDTGLCTTTAHACVDMSRNPGNSAVANRIRDAMSAGWTSAVTATGNGNPVSLRQGNTGIAYDLAITVQGQSIAVASSPAAAQAAIVVQGMTGGAGCHGPMGSLPAQRCDSWRDCVSYNCSGGFCQ